MGSILVPFWHRFSESFFTQLLGGIFIAFGGNFGDFSELGGALEGKKGKQGPRPRRDAVLPRVAHGSGDAGR